MLRWHLHSSNDNLAHVAPLGRALRSLLNYLDAVTSYLSLRQRFELLIMINVLQPYNIYDDSGPVAPP